MRHRVKKRILDRDSKHRKSLFVNMIRSLVKHGEIQTVKGKAKEIKRLFDTIMHRALKDDVASRRQLHKFFGKRDIVNSIMERLVPLAKKNNRETGFTRIESLGVRRGDRAKMVRLSLVDQPKEIGHLKNVDNKKNKNNKK